MKQNTKLNRIGMVYNLNSIEERKQIMELKSQGKNSREIAEIMNKKIKSIQSVKSEERKSQYKEFQQRMISLVLENFKDQIGIDMTDKKRLSKQIRKLINQNLSSKQDSELRQLIPQGRKASNQRRIKEKILQIIVSQLQSRLNCPDDGLPTTGNQNQKDTQFIYENFENIINKSYSQ